MENLLKEIFGGRPAGTILMLWGRLKDIFMGGGLSMNKLFAALLILGQILGIMTLDIGLKPAGQKLDLDKFSLVWSDEFDGSEIDRNIWDGHYVYGDAAEIR
ncbi:MAG TPA: hypothetical protein PKW24_05120, partial [Clostridiales bacterium]|nr:hypothetical protein [Clostridiales bacterium]